MGHHFEPDLLGARSAIRPILGDIQINGDALEKLVAGIDLMTEEDLSKIRRAGILRAKADLLRKAEEATAHARARGARRITVEDVILFDRYNDGEFNGVLAREFGVRRNPIQKVVKREKFRRDRKQ